MLGEVLFLLSPNLLILLEPLHHLHQLGAQLLKSFPLPLDELLVEITVRHDGLLPFSQPPESAVLGQRKMGDDLLSHEVSLAVPSALTGLTSLFGMGRGVSPPPSSPFLKGLYSIVKAALAASDLWKLHSATKPLSPRLISTTRLNTSLHLHLWPINLVVYQESYSLEGMGGLISRGELPA